MSPRISGEREACFHGHSQDPVSEDADTRCVTAIPRQPNHGASPLSFAQERIWLSDQLNPGSHSSRQFGVRVRGALVISGLEGALNALLRRYAVFRTTYHVQDGEPRQMVNPDCPIALAVVDLTAWPEDQREGIARRLAVQASAQVFDLQSEPLLRAKLLRLEADHHVLLFTTHQIVMDKPSQAVFLDELLSLYEGEQLPDLPFQYTDFAAWQRDQVKGRVFRGDLRYWHRHLKGALILQNFPADRTRPPVRGFRSARVPVTVNHELTEKLRTISQRADCTLSVAMLAAFQAVVQRYTGNDDIIVGVPVGNRDLFGTATPIGHFANTLAIRTQILGDPTFAELLQQVGRISRDAYAHQDVPFEKLIEKLKLPRDLSFAPLVQLLFEFEKATPCAREIAGLMVTPFALDFENSDFDLTLHLEEADQGLSGWIQFAADLFDRATIERFVSHYHTLLGGIATNPSEHLSRLPLLSAEECAWQRTHFDRRSVRPPSVPCVHELISAQVEMSPDAVAVECAGEQLTYAELDLRSERLARVLSTLDIGPNDLVGVCVTRSLEMVIALLGVLKAGAAYVPLDPAFPEERLVQIMQDAQPRALLTTLDAAHNFSLYEQEGGGLDADEEVPTIYLDAEVWDGIAYDDIRRPRSCARPEDLAYVIYTSGSAAHPKGVQVSHRAFSNLVGAMQTQPGIGCDDTLLAITSLALDMASLELLLPLTVGAKVVIACDASTSDGCRLAQLIEQVRPTIIQATPSTWRSLLETGWRGHRRLKILCGGEAWSEDLAEQLLGRCGSLWNMYGPTETAVWSSVCEVKPDEPVFIGAPIPNASFHILDQHQRPVPIGVPGELYIGGDGVALGYLRQSALTAQSFVPDPFRSGGNSRLYRTGDRVRFRPEGRIEFLGRMDSQVMIRGFRVEPGDVEAALRTHPAVAQAVVVAREDAPASKQLVAYVVPAPEQQISTEALQKFLRHTLPEYTMPSAIVTLRVLPTLPNGRMDHGALPLPEDPRSVAEQATPRSESEETILQIWREVLGTAHVGLDDSFFDLGGTSLLVLRMHRRLCESLNREFPIVVLFENTTVSRLSTFLDRFLRCVEPVVDFVSVSNSGPVDPAIQPRKRPLYASKGKGSPNKCEGPARHRRAARRMAAASLRP